MADNAEGESDPQVTFKVKTSGDGLHTLTMAESATVLELKTKIASEEVENIPVERQRLIYSGRVMKNDDTLGSYKIKNNNTIHLVKSAASNHPPGGASSAAASAAGGAGVAPAVPTNMAAGTPANNILAGLTGARFAGHMPLPSQDIFGPDGGMNLPSEEQITEMMSNPMVAQSVNEALNNPDFVEFLLQNNPALRATPNARELIQSPLFRTMLTDPESMRMMARMRRAMGGQNAFPAPGATDNTPAGAPASGTAAPGAAGAAGANPQMANPFGANPFMPFFNPNLAAPGAAPGATGTAAGTDSTTRSGDAAAGTTPTTGAGATGAAGTEGAGAANPFASLFGAGGAGGFPQMTPEMMQQAMQMLGGAGGAAGNPFMPQATPPVADSRPPEERYADQLRQLNDMGFYDFDQNVAALRRSGGSVQGAIQHLLGD